MENCITKAFLFALKKREREREVFGKKNKINRHMKIFVALNFLDYYHFLNLEYHLEFTLKFTF